MTEFNALSEVIDITAERYSEHASKSLVEGLVDALLDKTPQSDFMEHQIVLELAGGDEAYMARIARQRARAVGVAIHLGLGPLEGLQAAFLSGIALGAQAARLLDAHLRTHTPDPGAPPAHGQDRS